MGTVIRRAIQEDMFPVDKLLRKSDLVSRSLPVFARQRAFRPVWGGQEPYYGYLLENDGEVVGFLGTLFTRRNIGGRMEDFCELHNWYVLEEYRNESLNLLIPILALKRQGKTIVNFTPTQAVYEFGRKFGFQDLDKSLLLLHPLPLGTRRIKITTSPWLVSDFLNGNDLQIFNDHKDIHCIHMAIVPENEPGERPIYAVMKTMRRRWFERYGRLFYINDPGRFAKLADSICWRLCAKYRWHFIAANERDFETTPPTAYTKLLPRTVPSQFLSANLRASDITPLYSVPLLEGYQVH